MRFVCGTNGDMDQDFHPRACECETCVQVCCCGDEYRHHDEYCGHPFVEIEAYLRRSEEKVERKVEGFVHEGGTRWIVTLEDGRTFEVETSGGWMDVRAYWTSHEGEARKVRVPVADAVDPFVGGSSEARLQAQRYAVWTAAQEIAKEWQSLGGSGFVMKIWAEGSWHDSDPG